MIVLTYHQIKWSHRGAPLLSLIASVLSSKKRPAVCDVVILCLLSGYLSAMGSTSRIKKKNFDIAREKKFKAKLFVFCLSVFLLI